MTTRMKENIMKALFIIIIMIVLIFQSVFSQAQSPVKSIYKGFEVNFGTRSFTMESNIPQINQSDIVHAGGKAGLVYGNNSLRTKIGFGYYSTVGKNNNGTVNLYETNASANFYPLSLIRKKTSGLEPYLTGGIAYDNFKLYGYYLHREPGNTNYSNAEAPYLGSLKQVNTTFGVGLEMKIIDRYDFIHLFSEIIYGHNISSGSKHAEFNKTGIKNQMQMNVGITFGAHR